jgi:hypothetical protein
LVKAPAFFVLPNQIPPFSFECHAFLVVPDTIRLGKSGGF